MFPGGARRVGLLCGWNSIAGLGPSPATAPARAAVLELARSAPSTPTQTQAQSLMRARGTSGGDREATSAADPNFKLGGRSNFVSRSRGGTRMCNEFPDLSAVAQNCCLRRPAGCQTSGGCDHSCSQTRWVRGWSCARTATERDVASAGWQASRASGLCW